MSSKPPNARNGEPADGVVEFGQHLRLREAQPLLRGQVRSALEARPAPDQAVQGALEAGEYVRRPADG